MCPQPAARPVSRAASPLPGGCVPGLPGGQVHLDAHMPTQPCPRPRKQPPARSVWTPTRRPPWEAWPGLMPVTRWPVGPAGTWHWTESLTLWRPRAGGGALRESLLGCESSVAGRGPRLHWAVPLQGSEDHRVQPHLPLGCIRGWGGRFRGPIHAGGPGATVFGHVPHVALEEEPSTPGTSSALPTGLAPRETEGHRSPWASGVDHCRLSRMHVHRCAHTCTLHGSSRAGWRLVSPGSGLLQTASMSWHHGVVLEGSRRRGLLPNQMPFLHSQEPCARQGLCPVPSPGGPGAEARVPAGSWHCVPGLLPSWAGPRSGQGSV